MSKEKKLKEFPAFKTDEEAEKFVETVNLAEYDMSGFKPVRFEFEKKASQINMRVPTTLLEAVKSKASAKGVPFTRYIRMLLEQDVSRR